MPERILEISVLKESSQELVPLLHRLFQQGWETLDPTTYCPHHRIYTARLYFPLHS